MIETLYGTIFELDPVSGIVIIECAGVGYRVSVTANTVSKLPSPKFSASGKPVEFPLVRIYTHMSIREDGVDLYGFYDRDELSMFKLLIGVSGIGPKAGLSILSLLTPKKLIAAIAAGDSKAISKAPGVGPKTAARVILELKDKVSKMPQYSENISDDVQTAPIISSSSKLSDAADALSVLGYSRSEIASAMKNVDAEKTLEEIIKSALAALMK